MKDYNDKTIWIIGASSGIGAALARNLSAKGAHVILSARGEKKLAEVRASINRKNTVLSFDVSDKNDVFRATKRIFQEFERVDSVLFLAALYEPSEIKNLPIHTVENIVQVNLMGMFYVVDAVLPHLLQKKQGQIALCGSVAAYRGLPKGQPYSATKAAIMSFAQTLRCEAITKGIDVKLISPGFVRTPLTAKNNFSMPMIIEPETAAEYIAKGLLSSKFEISFPFGFMSVMKIIQIIPDWLYFKLFRLP